ncbi:hypothetical protein P3W85_24660 [Cupriavidus basilensis]|uniref:Uncharacterized protein n=1 Tax=Cupriavidus basilensis TaxID=68895 RepID=A0ABT6AU50_9BURK|nr:hypothetical protein [Cupriavidus basilensis]MDF3836118.1 hypothetical protein [Cupriavidus basilensis]
MSPCPACLAIETNRSGAPGHTLLRITDTQRIKVPRQPAMTVSTFVCQDCGTGWIYRDEKNTDTQGWQPAPQTALAADPQ